MMKKYLGARFSLTKSDAPHQMKFWAPPLAAETGRQDQQSACPEIPRNHCVLPLKGYWRSNLVSIESYRTLCVRVQPVTILSRHSWTALDCSLRLVQHGGIWNHILTICFWVVSYIRSLEAHSLSRCICFLFGELRCSAFVGYTLWTSMQATSPRLFF